nr:unnamed protein product [Digitaria exilis]
MNGADLAADCSNATELSTFERSMTRQLWKHDALLLTEAVLAGIIVAIGAYGQRYRHQPSTRFIFLGATTLFLPIISSLVSTVGTDANYVVPLRTEDGDDLNQSLLVAKCTGTNNSIFLVVWAFLVQLILINTSTLVSVDDREGKSKGPPLELLVQGLWTLYLGTTILTKEFFVSGNFLIEVIGLVEVFVPFALLISKLALKYYAFKKARRSFALGRNPALISAYMQQLQAQEANQNGEPPVSEDAPPPPLLVMREEEIQMEMQPGGYAFKDDSAGTTLINNVDLLVTVDKVWDLDRVLQISTLQLKDLCLSFALFKLLRCRFARYKLTNASSMGTLTFFRSLLLKMGDHDRLLPDNVAWSKSLYEAVKKDAKHALAGHSAARLSTIEYQQLIETLSQNSKHELLKNGVKLGKQLVETIEEEEMAWKLLADFWSEMILYVAPSDNLEGHKEAIARGGELITLLWAMLFHAGIVSRPGEEDGVAAATTSAGAV